MICELRADPLPVFADCLPIGCCRPPRKRSLPEAACLPETVRPALRLPPLPPADDPCKSLQFACTETIAVNGVRPACAARPYRTQAL